MRNWRQNVLQLMLPGESKLWTVRHEWCWAMQKSYTVTSRISMCNLLWLKNFRKISNIWTYSQRPELATKVVGEHLISHNSWTNLARKLVKTSLDPKDRIELIENDKKISLQSKFWTKIHICALPYWNFSKIRGKCEKTHIASSLAARSVFWASTTVGIVEKQDRFETF